MGKKLKAQLEQSLKAIQKDGKLLAYNDSQGNYSVEDLVSFYKFCRSSKELPIEEALKKWKPY